MMRRLRHYAPSVETLIGGTIGLALGVSNLVFDGRTVLWLILGGFCVAVLGVVGWHY